MWIGNFFRKAFGLLYHLLLLSFVDDVCLDAIDLRHDSGLCDSDDIAEAYSNGFHTAKQTLQITVTTVCPICMESLL